MPCCEQGVANDTTSAFKPVCLACDYVEKLWESTAVEWKNTCEYLKMCYCLMNQIADHLAHNQQAAIRRQGRGKVFYVGGAVGGGGSQFLRINITQNRNRKSCYSLPTFMRY